MGAPVCRTDWFGAVGNTNGAGDLWSDTTLQKALATDLSEAGSLSGTLTATWNGRS